MVVSGALFVAEAASVVIQVAVFRSSRRRVFRMAPFHHHFELAGWAETTVIIRFWLLAAIARSEEHTSELQSLMRNSYAVFCLKKKTKNIPNQQHTQQQHTPMHSRQ